MKGFLSKVQQKKGTGNVSEGKPATSVGTESSVRADITIPRSQRRYVSLLDLLERAKHIGSIWMNSFCPNEAT